MGSNGAGSHEVKHVLEQEGPTVVGGKGKKLFPL